MSELKITPGFWRTRDGRKAEVGAINESVRKCNQCVGWVNGSVFSWSTNGSWVQDTDEEIDLIAPWTDPVPWDWSTTPPWIDCIIQGPSGRWYMCESVACAGTDGIVFNGSGSYQIPPKYAPQWSGDWKQSKTVRPGYKEAKSND